MLRFTSSQTLKTVWESTAHAVAGTRLDKRCAEYAGAAHHLQAQWVPLTHSVEAGPAAVEGAGVAAAGAAVEEGAGAEAAVPAGAGPEAAAEETSAR